VAERHVLGVVHESELLEVIKSVLAKQGAFPERRQGSLMYEGAVIMTDTGQPEITWERLHPTHPTIVAQRRRETFTDLDSAIRAYIDSEWSRGIDGIAIRRLR
jgi:hypothetical protein